MRQFPPLGDHCLRFDGGYFGANRAGNDFADFLNDIDKIAAAFVDQRRVGGNAVKQAGFREFADIIYFGGIDKELHVIFPKLRSAALFAPV